jgi:hypothetical protein
VLHTLRHQAGDECDIARKPVELGNQHRAFRLAGCGEGGGQLRPAIECARLQPEDRGSDRLPPVAGGLPEQVRPSE